MSLLTVYHVTSPENAASIMNEGFEGSYGDDGFGVYTYGTFENAVAYALDGGWDGELKAAVILELTVDPEDMDEIQVDPSWPNPEDYTDVLVHYMDEDEGSRWMARCTLIPVEDYAAFEAFAGSPLDIRPVAETPAPSCS